MCHAPCWTSVICEVSQSAMGEVGQSGMGEVGQSGMGEVGHEPCTMLIKV